MKVWMFWCLVSVIASAGDQVAPSWRLEFTEELRFGAVEDDEHYMWPSLQTMILPAPKGHIYIFDHDSARALLFDGHGNFVKQVARRGEGPGELQYMNSVSRTADGTIFIMDTPSPGNEVKIKRYAPDMTFLGEISTIGLSKRADTLFVSSDGKHMGGLFVTFNPETGGLIMNTGLLRLANREVTHLFYEEQSSLPSANIKSQNKWIDIIAEGAVKRHRAGLMVMGGDGLVYTATADKYEISQWAPGKSEPIRLISRKYKPRMFSEEDRMALVEHHYANMGEGGRAIITRTAMEKGFEKAELTVHSPLVGLIAIEDKGILAVREADVVTRKNVADVFSTKGDFLCQVEMSDAAMCVPTPDRWTPINRMIFHQGKAYTLITDEEGDQIAVRYGYALVRD